MFLLGLIFILLGILFLLRNLGLLPIEIWSAFWPSLFIILGLYIVFLNYKVKTFWQRLRGKVISGKIID